MTVLVTGAAGFIGYHVADALLRQGRDVVGVDNLSPYYSVALKQARLARLSAQAGFRFVKLDIADPAALAGLPGAGIDTVIHLAAQAGVRHSLIDPYIYVTANLMGQVAMLEWVRALRGLRHFVYASSSSVYGRGAALPFSTGDRADQPASLYAASKRGTELIAEAYCQLYAMPATGLRFFTVYGPWGRPDMSAYIFTAKILAGEPIPVFNHGKMRRDYTFIDDIVAGVVACADMTPPPGHRLYNLGNHGPETLMDFIDTLARACGVPARMEMLDMQMGDVAETYADIAAASADFGFRPKTTIATGLPKFVAWYRDYHKA
jgi:UDP-glucuronate 4-epimerase